MRRAAPGLLVALWTLGVAAAGAQAVKHPAQRAESLEQGVAWAERQLKVAGSPPA